MLLLAFPVCAQPAAKPFSPHSPLSSQKLLTINFKDADIKDVLTAISLAAGINIVADSTVQGKMTISLKNMTVDDALAAVAGAAQIYMQKNGKVVTFSKTKPVEPLKVEVKDGRLTLEANRADLKEVLQKIGAAARMSFVPGGSVQGQVTITLNDVPVVSGVEAMLKSQGFEMTSKDDGLYFVDRPQPPPAPRPQPVQPPATAAPPSAAAVTPRTPGAGTTGNTAAVTGKVKPATPATFDLQLENAKLADALQEVASKSGKPISLIGDVQGTRSVRLHGTTAEEALQTLLLGTKYAFVAQGDGYLVGDASTLSSPEAVPFLVTEKVPLKYLKADDVPLFLSSSTSKDSVRPLKDESAIMVTGTRAQVDRIKQEIATADVPAAQVMLQSTVIELTDTTDLDLGFEYQGEFDRLKGTGPTGMNLIFSSPKAFSRSLVTTLTAAVTDGKGRVLANPRVATINGQKADIKIQQVRYFRTGGVTNPTTGTTGTGSTTQQTTGTTGSNVVSPFFQSDIQQIPAGIDLEITPWIGAAGDITVEVTTEVSSLAGTGPDGLPEINTRSATTTVQVKDGDTIAIGGLKQKEETSSVSKPWLLGDIPLIGKLFQHKVSSKRETELVILITPRIMSDLDPIRKVR